MDELYTQFDAVFFEKTRLSLITVLYGNEEWSFTRLKRMFGLTDGSAYSHLQKLADAGYVGSRRLIRRERAETWYTLTAHGISVFSQYLSLLESISGEDNE